MSTTEPTETQEGGSLAEGGGRPAKPQAGHDFKQDKFNSAVCRFCNKPQVSHERTAPQSGVVQETEQGWTPDNPPGGRKVFTDADYEQAAGRVHNVPRLLRRHDELLAQNAELLEALEAMLDCCGQFDTDARRSAMKQARAAIARARGAS
mgnify:CR=1 FL=1